MSKFCVIRQISFNWRNKHVVVYTNGEDLNKIRTYLHMNQGAWILKKNCIKNLNTKLFYLKTEKVIKY